MVRAKQRTMLWCMPACHDGAACVPIAFCCAGNQLLQDNLDGFMFIRKRHAPAPAQQEPSPKRNTLVPQPTHSDDRLLSTGQSGALHTSMQHSPRLQPQPQPEAAAPLCEQQLPPDLASVVQQCLPEGCPMHIRLQLMVAQLLSRHAAHPQVRCL